MAGDAAITVSAPGSLMLLGEHAVLHGRRALVCAINRRITVTLSPLKDDTLEVISVLGEYTSPLRNLVDHTSFRFVLQAVRQHTDRIPSGFRLKIDSGFSSDIGFGSSSAVTVAVHGALMQWIFGEPPAHRLLFDQALQTVHAVQGRGSGADLAAAVCGGIVAYAITPSFEPIPVSLPLTAVYCGYKTPTPEVILRVEQQRSEHPDEFERMYDEIDSSVGQALKALKTRDLQAFGSVLNRNHEYMVRMGVSTPELEEIVAALRSSPDIFGAKISGSGLGDCAVGIGYADLKAWGDAVYHLETAPTGCEYHE